MLNKIIFLTFFILSSTYASQLFIGTAKSDGIYTSKLNIQTGELSPIKCVAKINRPSFLSIDSKNRNLYCTNLNNFNDFGEIVSFKIQHEGKLNKLNSVSSEGLNPCHLNICPSKKVLFTVNYGAPNKEIGQKRKSHSIASYKIQKNGQLSRAISRYAHFGESTHPKRQKEPHAHSVVPHPDDPYVYAADLGADAIFIYEYDRDSANLTPFNKIIIPGGGVGPRHMKWTKDGCFLYLINELNLTLSVFKYLGQGELKLIDNIDAYPKTKNREELTAAEIRLHPHLPIIYVSIRDKIKNGRDSITIFKKNNNQVRKISTIPAKVEFPRNFNIDSTGKWLVIAGQRSQDIVVLSVDKNGMPGNMINRYAFPGEPICLEFFEEN